MKHDIIFRFHISPCHQIVYSLVMWQVLLVKQNMLTLPGHPFDGYCWWHRTCLPFRGTQYDGYWLWSRNVYPFIRGTQSDRYGWWSRTCLFFVGVLIGSALFLCFFFSVFICNCILFFFAILYLYILSVSCIYVLALSSDFGVTDFFFFYFDESVFLATFRRLFSYFYLSFQENDER